MVPISNFGQFPQMFFLPICRHPVDAALRLPLGPPLSGGPAEQLRLAQLQQLGQAALQRWELVPRAAGSAVAPAADETNDLAEATCVIRHRRGWDDGGDDPQFETAFETSRCEMNQHIQTGVLMTLFMTPGSWEWDAFFWELVLHHHWCYMGSRFSHLRLLPPGFMSLSLGVSFFAYLISLAEHTYQPKKRLSAGRNWKKMEGRTCRRKSFRQKHRVSFWKLTALMPQVFKNKIIGGWARLGSLML